jgi:bacterioferritin-associated ferredoxin
MRSPDRELVLNGRCQRGPGFLVHQPEGVSMIVCVCNNISDREIRQAIDLGISTMDELREALGVATCCGNCLDYAVEVLNEHVATTPIRETVLKRPTFTS